MAAHEPTANRPGTTVPASSSTGPSAFMQTPLIPMPVPSNRSRMPKNGGSLIGPRTGLGWWDGCGGADRPRAVRGEPARGHAGQWAVDEVGVHGLDDRVPPV